jgi:hypothetical protein
VRIHSAIACLVLIAATPAAAAPVGPGAGAAIARAVGSCGNPCTVVASNGGRIIDFEDAGDAIRAGARQKLVIDGYCASACMVLADRARPRACITDRAVFAYHKTNLNRPIPLRSDLHRWIMDQGGYPEFTGTPGIMPNSVAQRFWPQCQSA